jgi:hypothetical protein
MLLQAYLLPIEQEVANDPVRLPLWNSIVEIWNHWGGTPMKKRIDTLLIYFWLIQIRHTYP